MDKPTATTRITGHAREAGRNVVHTVELDGEVVATRRSAHRYSYAIAYWTRTPSGSTIVVSRWSRSPNSTGSSFAIPLVADAPPVAHPFGAGIAPGASVTSRGRSGAGQPEISGVVERMERDEAIVRTIDGKIRRRSARNLRRVD